MNMFALKMVSTSQLWDAWNIFLHNSSSIDTNHVWVAHTNTDCTEGRGYEVPICVTKLKSTAQRLGKGRYVQGSDSPVAKVPLLVVDGVEFVPLLSVAYVVPPTREDEVLAKEEDYYEQAVKRLRSLGATDEEIKALSKAKG